MLFNHEKQGGSWQELKIGKLAKYSCDSVLCQVTGAVCINKTIPALDCVHTMPAHFENGRKLDGKDSLQGFDAKEVCLHPKNLSVSFQKRLKLFCFHHFQVFTQCCFQNVPIRVRFSKSTVFKICQQKMCRFRVNRRSIRRIFHRFQNVPASCERSLRL